MWTVRCYTIDGMTECIIAAALARIGHRVLHLDRNDYYSGDWGTFHFEAIRKWIARQQGQDKEPLTINSPKESLIKEGEAEIPLKIESESVSDVNEQILIPDELPEKEPDPTKDDTREQSSDEKCESESSTNMQPKESSGCVDDVDAAASSNMSEETGEKSATGGKSATVDSAEHKVPTPKEWCFNEMKKLWRKFNIDLHPKILYCRGLMVQLLISSDIAKYCEFKSITRVLTLLDGKLQKVPCSRADVFSSKQVSMVEKRMLMKLLTFCMEYDKHPEEYHGFEDKTFDEFLAARQLTANVRHYVKFAIAMATSKTTTMEGLQSTQKFLQSLGRYGNTAFLWPLYGSGEMPQCFCRMCAVFGGIYCLRRTGVSLIVDKDKKCKGIIDSEGQRLEAKWIVLESSYTTGEMLPKEKPRSISRAIFLIDRSMQAPGGEHISLLTLPLGDDQDSMVNIIELAPTSMACPKDTHLVHMTCAGTKGPKLDFAAATKKLFQSLDPASQDESDTRPKVLWSLSFSQEGTTNLTLNDHGLEGVHVVASPDGQLDFDNSIKEARGIFEQLCPGEEFLPRAPNPEDIIYDDDQQGPNADGSGFEQATDTDTTEGTATGTDTTAATATDMATVTATVSDITITEGTDTETAQTTITSTVPMQDTSSSEDLPKNTVTEDENLEVVKTPKVTCETNPVGEELNSEVKDAIGKPEASIAES